MSSTEAEIWIYDEIGPYGIGAREFADEVGALDVDNLTVRINSPGGSLFDGLTIANVLIRHRARVHVTVDGIAASIASVIAMAGDEITMARGSQMMIHCASSLIRGNAQEMIEMAELLRKVDRDSIARAYQAKAGGELADWLEAMGVESWYDGPEAVAAGLADTVAATAASAGVAARWTRHSDELLGSGNYLSWAAAAVARGASDLRANQREEMPEPEHDVKVSDSPRGAGWQRRTRGSLTVDAPTGAHRPNMPAAIRARTDSFSRVAVLAVPPASRARREAADAERHERSEALKARIRTDQRARRTDAEPVPRRRTPAERHALTVALRARNTARKAEQDRAARRLLGTGGVHILR